jgi:hypothetical protein
MRKISCVDSSSWLTTRLCYYFPLCDANNLACMTVDLFLSMYIKFWYSVCLAINSYFIMLELVYSFSFVFSILHSALPMFSKQVAAFYTEYCVFMWLIGHSRMDSFKPLTGE